MAIDWKKVTTEDLRATFCNYPNSAEAKPACEEYERRCGADTFTRSFKAGRVGPRCGELTAVNGIWRNLSV